MRSASSSSHTINAADTAALGHAQVCIDLLVAAIQTVEPSSSSPPPKSSEFDDQDQAHRLNLTLISTLPSLPLPVLTRTLGLIRDILLSLPAGSDARKELVEDLFAEILERVGDREKEFAMKWWYEHREELVAGEATEIPEKSDDEATAVARL